MALSVLKLFVQTLKRFIRDLLIYNCLLIASNITGTYEYQNKLVLGTFNRLRAGKLSSARPGLSSSFLITNGISSPYKRYNAQKQLPLASDECPVRNAALHSREIKS